MSRLVRFQLLLIFLFLVANPCLADEEASKPFPAVDAAVNAAITRGDIPGAVVLVAHDGKVVFRRAYGLRSVEPISQSMTADTIFDVSSLTKVVATAPASRLRRPILPRFDIGPCWQRKRANATLPA